MNDTLMDSPVALAVRFPEKVVSRWYEWYSVVCCDVLF